MKLLSSITGGATTISNAIAASTDNAAVDVMALIMTMVDKAVLAAENAFYNGDIKADERKDICINQFVELCEAAGIELTEAQMAVVETLIAASCEALGHGKVAAIEGMKNEST